MNHFTASIQKAKAIMVTLLLMSSFIAQAQQSPIFSQYSFNRLALNPAYAGSQDQLSINAIHRRQWQNLEGAPNSCMISAHSYVREKNIGLGMLISSDRIGIHSDTRAYMMYAYKVDMPKGKLSLGLQAGFSRLDSDFSMLAVRNQEDVAMQGDRVDFNPNFGTGIYYSNQDFYLGFSIPYMLNNKLNVNDEVIANSTEARYYLLTAGMALDLGRQAKLIPSVLVRVQEGNAIGVDLNVNVEFADILTVGASVRSEKAASMLMALNISENLRFGYSYDFTTHDLGKYSDQTMEIMLNYRIPRTKLCHTYF